LAPDVYDIIYLPKSSSFKNKKHTICKNDMFYVHGKFSRNRMKINEAYSPGAFACIFDRHAKKFAKDARKCVGWGQGSLGFQRITLIQKIPATTFSSRLQLC
jgi:hypothetical protein